MERQASFPGTPSPRIRFAVLAVFAAAMGWLEGVVVVYIRGLLGVAQHDALPRGDEVMRRFAALPWLLRAEQSRELATLVMLATVAWLTGDRARSRIGGFLIAFGIWDIVYYVALYAMLGWPASPMDMDVLFLIPPHPWWSQPVWVPIAISCLLIAAGTRFSLASSRASR